MIRNSYFALPTIRNPSNTGIAERNALNSASMDGHFKSLGSLGWVPYETSYKQAERTCCFWRPRAIRVLLCYLHVYKLPFAG